MQSLAFAKRASEWGLLEVLLSVVPALYQSITQAERCGRIGLLARDLVPVASKCVFQVIDNALLYAPHIACQVRICRVFTI